MTLETLRAQVQTDAARARRMRWAVALCGAVGVALSAYLALAAPNAFVRAGEGLLAVGFVVFAVFGWRRMEREGRAPEAAEACVAFLRRRLIERRRAVRGGWVAMLAPLLPGVAVTAAGLVIASGGRWERLAPIALLWALWLAAMFALQARQAAKVTAEIARLDRMSV